MAPCIGPHVDRSYAKGKRPNFAAHIAEARARARDLAGFDIRAVALFAGGPRTRTITLQDTEAAELREYLAREEVRALAHSVYPANPWRGDPDAARQIREEAAICARAGIEGLVVHLPKLLPEDVVTYAARLVAPEGDGVRILLETPAVKPTESYYETPEKLAALFQALRDKVDPRLERFGVCVDTAHLWTCGVDLAGYSAAEGWFARLDDLSPLLPPAAVALHLNDSAHPRGVGPDTHAPLAQGFLWKAYRDRLQDSGLAAVLDYAQRHDVPTILERGTHEELLDDYRLLRPLVSAGPA